MTYQRSMEISDGDFRKTIKYEYYNTIREKDNK